MKGDVQARATVLLVEDEWLVRDVIAAELEEAGFSVIQAGEAQEALALLSQIDRLELLFTDIKLPGRLSGWDIAEEARIRMPDLPIIYATGFSEGRERQLGRSYFLPKPFDPKRLLQAVRELGVM